MATLVLRLVKGSPLTNTEMDNNFSNLNTDVGTRVLKAGDTMTGDLTLAGAPSNANHATTKTYVDTADNARLQLAGGTMTGKLTTRTVDLTAASLLIGVGSQDPTTPVAGDLWNNGGALKFQVAAATKTLAFTDSNITGNAATATKWAAARTITVDTDSTGSVAIDGSGNVTLSLTAVRAPKWTTARAITATGDASWTVTVDGSAAASAALTLASVNANVGTFGDGASISVPAFTVNAKGLITAASSAVIRAASTIVSGVVQLTDSTSTTSSTLAATATAVKAANDLASTANGTANAALSRSGGTMTGNIVLVGAPSSALHPATKTYVDDRVQVYNAAGTRIL
jgi:hypothetical protein